MTNEHLAAMRSAIEHAAARNDLEDVKYLQEVADLVKANIVVEIPKGSYSLEEFKRIAGEKLP